MSTWGAVRTEIKSLLNQSDEEIPAFFSTAEINAWMHRGCIDLMQDTEINYKIVNYTFVADVASIALATINVNNLLLLKGISLKDVDDDVSCTRKLNIVNMIDFNRLKDEEDVYVCSIYNNTLYFNTTVATGSIISIAGRWDVAFDDVDATAFPLPVSSEDAVIKYAVAMGFIKRGDKEAFSVFFALYNDRKKNLENVYRTIVDATYPKAMQEHKTKNSLYAVRNNTVEI